MISRAVVIGLLKDAEVLMTQRSTHLVWEPGAWHQPGGMVEPGESVHEAAIRETYEEVGVNVALKDLRFLGIANYRETNGRDVNVYFFSTAQWQGEPQIVEKEKTQDMRWFPVDALPSGTPEHARVMFEDLSRSHFVELLDGRVIHESSGVQL